MSKRKRKKRRVGGGGQAELAFPPGRGGRRKGAGRKPVGERARVTHRARPKLAPRFPVHVTMRLEPNLPSLREYGPFEVLRTRLVAGCERFGFRLVEYSVQSNHIHLVAEANDARSLARGMQGLSVRIARGLNKLWGRKGQVFADRYHSRILRSPTEVRRAIAYVLNNARRHGVKLEPGSPDLHSSGPWFTGWKGAGGKRLLAHLALPLARARSWLLQTGWRLRGLIPIDAIPGPVKAGEPRRATT